MKINNYREAKPEDVNVNPLESVINYEHIQ